VFTVDRIHVDSNAAGPYKGRRGDSIYAAERIKHERCAATPGEPKAPLCQCYRKRGRMPTACRFRLDRLMGYAPGVTSAVDAATVAVPPNICRVRVRHADSGPGKVRATFERKMEHMLPRSVEVPAARDGPIMPASPSIDCDRLHPNNLVLQREMGSSRTRDLQ